VVRRNAGAALPTTERYALPVEAPGQEDPLAEDDSRDHLGSDPSHPAESAPAPSACLRSSWPAGGPAEERQPLGRPVHISPMRRPNT
jgi:hypothetical protein